MAGEREAAARAAYFNPLLFFGVFLTGSAYIIGAKFNSASPFAVTTIPVVLMVIYAALVKFVGVFRLREDQAGDNLYYLGFLYTLTSLGVSLYQFRADGPAEEIVQNFGVAVGSTIAGVALRILFNQMRRDPADVEQAARLELSEAARKVRQELDATVVELAHFRRSAQQQVSEGFEYVREEMEQVSGRILTSFEGMTERAAKPFETASESSSAVLTALSKTISENLETAAKRLADENTKLASETGEIATALKATAKKLTAMQTPDKIIEVRLTPIAAELASTIASFAEQVRAKAEGDKAILEAIAASGESQGKQTAVLSELVTSLKQTATSIVSLEARSLAQSERTNTLIEKLDAARQQTEALQQDRDARLTEFKDAATTLTSAAASLEALLERAISPSEPATIEEQHEPQELPLLPAPEESTARAPAPMTSSFTPFQSVW